MSHSLIEKRYVLNNFDAFVGSGHVRKGKRPIVGNVIRIEAIGRRNLSEVSLA